MSRKQPGYLRRTDDPIAFVACRDRRISRPTGKDLARSVLALRVCAPILADVFGLGVLRKHLWRALRGTPLGDEIESRGMDEAPPTEHLLSIAEITGEARAHENTTIRAFGDALVNAMLMRPRVRWNVGDWPKMVDAPDAVLLERDKEWKAKLRGTKGLLRSCQPCAVPRAAACEIVHAVAVGASWRASPNGEGLVQRMLHGSGALAGACRFAGVDVSAEDVMRSIEERFAALNGCWKRGEPIVRVGNITIAGNVDRAQASLFDE